MKIKDNGIKATNAFEDFTAGECFRYYGSIYIVTDGGDLAVNLETGETKNFVSDEEVTKVEASLTVK